MRKPAPHRNKPTPREERSLGFCVVKSYEELSLGTNGSAVLLRASPVEDYLSRLEQNRDVEEKRQMLDIEDVVFELRL